MIDMQQAAGAAKKFVEGFFGVEYGDPSSIHVEEFERSEDGRHWNVTVSFLPKQPHPLLEFPGGLSARSLFGRVYKVVKVNSDTGKVDSVKMLMLA